MLTLLSSVVVPTITVVNHVVMIVAMTVTLVTIAMVGMTDTVRERTVTGMIVAIVGNNGLGRLLAAAKSKIVAPGLHLPGGIMMKEGLQGTMIGEVAMMTGEALTHITMTAAGMTRTDAGTIAAETRGKIVTRTGRGMPTGITVGRAEFGQVFRITSVCVVDPKWFPKRRSGLPPSRFASNRFLLYGKGVVYLELEGYPAIVYPPIFPHGLAHHRSWADPFVRVGGPPSSARRVTGWPQCEWTSISKSSLDRYGPLCVVRPTQERGLRLGSLRRLSELVEALTGQAGCL